MSNDPAHVDHVHHEKRAQALEDIVAQKAAGLEQFDSERARARAARLDADKAEIAAAEKRATARRERQSVDVLKDIAKVKRDLAAFGSSPLTQAEKIGAQLRPIHTRSVAELGQHPHQHLLIAGIAQDDPRVGHHGFFSCEPGSTACANAERIMRRVVEGCGARELMQTLIEFGAIVEKEMGAIHAHHISELTAERAKAAAGAVTFGDVIRAVRAVDDRAQAALDDNAFSSIAAVQRLARII